MRDKPNPPFRERALELVLQLAAEHVHEVGGNNRGPMVAAFLRSCGIDVPAAWCMALWHYAFARVGLVIGGGASVGNFQEWGKANGDLVTRPLRGDLGCWHSDSTSWPFHVFGVEHVLSLGPAGFLLRTVEGNTSSGVAGSQDDGDGVYRRTRRIPRNELVFVRVPGAPKANAPATTRYVLRRNLAAGGRWWIYTEQREEVKPHAA